MIEWLRHAATDPSVVVGSETLPILMTRKPRARRLIMRLAENGRAVEVTLPTRVPSAEAIRFVESRRDWLAQQLAKRRAMREPMAGGTVLYRGSPLPFERREGWPRNPRLLFDDEGPMRLELGGPQEGVATRLGKWLEGEATSLMSADLQHYCHAAGVAVPRLALSRAKRRWGSCSSKGTLRVNWRLVQAPDAVRRSVVAHEVAHLVHFDHSPRFHALLADIYEGDLPAANRWLKANGPDLYIDFG
ncbi:DUF45 domain-containing protein [Altererythrobacter aurantiacus]|uniref:DUF45 domain-containing protein n=1 Tax=Parapontixanthobacter aurantiacus TaxID=1463599 RepID=A0A844ZAZ6_9SPHN|nr:SprT family zinc-dependent metalloprotease [Parapontixanthobacter aurantiacus]MXO84472.1 DUF45 domain-containing protein [Parapontixanthobacter aurantiacus]